MLAHSMLATIPDNSITLFDKLFYSEDLLLTLNQKGCNRHWLLPAWKNIASEMIELGNTASPGTIPKRLEHLRGALEVVFITKRPRPSRPRSVKISKTRYPVKHSAAPLK
ncbi:transposase [Escherichia coli]|nr:transposase [Escherichia coli]